MATIKLSDYIMEQEVSTASCDDIVFEQLQAEYEVGSAIASAYIKKCYLEAYNEDYYSEATDTTEKKSIFKRIGEALKKAWRAIVEWFGRRLDSIKRLFSRDKEEVVTRACQTIIDTPVSELSGVQLKIMRSLAYNIADVFDLCDIIEKNLCPAMAKVLELSNRGDAYTNKSIQSQIETEIEGLLPLIKERRNIEVRQFAYETHGEGKLVGEKEAHAAYDAGNEYVGKSMSEAEKNALMEKVKSAVSSAKTVIKNTIEPAQANLKKIHEKLKAGGDLTMPSLPGFEGPNGDGKLTEDQKNIMKAGADFYEKIIGKLVNISGKFKDTLDDRVKILEASMSTLTSRALTKKKDAENKSSEKEEKDKAKKREDYIKDRMAKGFSREEAEAAYRD